MKIIFSLLLVTTTFYSGIYSLNIPSIISGNIDLSNYEGKKMLIVNIATNSNYTNQLADLEALYQAHQDSLIVIAVPSNTFGGEPRSNAQIRQFCDSVGVTFPISMKSIIVGPEAHQLFQWLTKQNLNGSFSSDIKSDFQKYLISKTGELIGVFPGHAPAGHPGILHAINN